MSPLSTLAVPGEPCRQLVELAPADRTPEELARALEGLGEAFGELAVGDQGDSEVDRGAADDVVVGQLLAAEVLGDVDDEVDLAVAEYIGVPFGNALPFAAEDGSGTSWTETFIADSLDRPSATAVGDVDSDGSSVSTLLSTGVWV